MRNLVYTSMLAAAMILPTTAVTAESGPDSFFYVSFELGDIIASTSMTGIFQAMFSNATTEAPFTARAGEPIQGSLVLPASGTSGEWAVSLVPSTGAPILSARGILSAESIQILGSHVDSTQVDLPTDTTSLRVVKGYVSATVTLVGELKRANCCTATLGIDANADGEISSHESQAVQAEGNQVKATIQLARAAPSVPYVFTIATPEGKTVARASGTYSFTKLNGVSANGEFDPDVVSFVTGSVERTPHLVKHDIGSSILLQTVPGSAREEEGPRVFFTMGTPVPPKSDDASQATQAAGTQQASADSTNTSPNPSLMSRILSFLTGTVFLAILAGSFLAALLAFAARRLMDRNTT